MKTENSNPMSKLQTYISERKKLFREKFIPESIQRYSEEINISKLGIPVVLADIESFNEETIEGCMAIVREVVEEKKKDYPLEGKMIDSVTYGINWANPIAHESLNQVLQALNTKE